MNRWTALLFAVGGTLCLLAVSFFIAMRKPLFVLLAVIVFVVLTGSGFALKARARRNDSNRSES